MKLVIKVTYPQPRIMSEVGTAKEREKSKEMKRKCFKNILEYSFRIFVIRNKISPNKFSPKED